MYWISGIQQIGIGVHDARAAWKWYRRNLGFDIPVFEDLGTAELMQRYTGGLPQERHAILAINLQGGGGLEFWQYTGRMPKSPIADVQIGDLGINVAKIKAVDVTSACSVLSRGGGQLFSGVMRDPANNECSYLKDVNGNLLQIIGSPDRFSSTASVTGGIYGAILGVVDIERSRHFYGELLGYDMVLYDRKDEFDDFATLPGGRSICRRVLLAQGTPRKGPFSNLLGESRIELVQALDRSPNRIYENRFWGDLGFIHLCFDVRGMPDLKKRCGQFGSPFTADSNPEDSPATGGSFEMGGSAGHFSYIEDPDGTLIEFVETHRIPIAKKFGWYLNLTRRTSEKPLPDWMLKTLRWSRVED
jgi:catechol 2,3-dioxygenase-like lactoylglutathione lyase family enzyme